MRSMFNVEHIPPPHKMKVFRENFPCWKLNHFVNIAFQRKVNSIIPGRHQSVERVDMMKSLCQLNWLNIVYTESVDNRIMQHTKSLLIQLAGALTWGKNVPLIISTYFRISFCYRTILQSTLFVLMDRNWQTYTGACSAHVSLSILYEMYMLVGFIAMLP